jgi:xanthine/uracil permease
MSFKKTALRILLALAVLCGIILLLMWIKGIEFNFRIFLGIFCGFAAWIGIISIVVWLWREDKKEEASKASAPETPPPPVPKKWDLMATRILFWGVTIAAAVGTTIYLYRFVRKNGVNFLFQYKEVLAGLILLPIIIGLTLFVIYQLTFREDI